MPFTTPIRRYTYLVDRGMVHRLHLSSLLPGALGQGADGLLLHLLVLLEELLTLLALRCHDFLKIIALIGLPCLDRALAHSVVRLPHPQQCNDALPSQIPPESIPFQSLENMQAASMRVQRSSLASSSQGAFSRGGSGLRVPRARFQRMVTGARRLDVQAVRDLSGKAAACRRFLACAHERFPFPHGLVLRERRVLLAHRLCTDFFDP